MQSAFALSSSSAEIFAKILFCSAECVRQADPRIRMSSERNDQTLLGL
jgi:hypothetical protein